MSKFTTMIPAYFEQDSFLLLGDLAAELGMKKAVILCGRSAISHAETAQKLLKRHSIQAAVFSDIQPEPTDRSIQKACMFARQMAGVDGIIAIGGGSCMDTAKCVNVLLNNPGTLEDYAATGNDMPTAPGLPLILIPTTAGTGAECTFSSIFVSTRNGQKLSVRRPNCTQAKLAIVDPKLSGSMPKRLAVITGIDALCHAFEAYTVCQPNPVSDALAKEAFSLIYHNLPLAISQTTETMCAKQAMANAASLAGMAFANTMLHLVHAIGHSLGAVLHQAHGLMVGQALPAVICFIADAVPERMRIIAAIMNISFSEKDDAAQIGRKIAIQICDFYKTVGFPTLKEMGVSPEQVFEAERFVRLDGCFRFSPKAISDPQIHALLARIYECSY